MRVNRKAERELLAAILRGELEVDQKGRVWRLAKRGWDRWKQTVVARPCKRVRAEHRVPLGYLQLRIMVDSKQLQTGAHRIVYLSSVGEIPDGMTINHKNGIKSDNRPSNLEVMTYKEQMLHATHVLKAGGAANQRGEENHQHRLTKARVAEIRRHVPHILDEMHHRQSRTISLFARRFGVRYQTVWDVVRGRTWKDRK